MDILISVAAKIAEYTVAPIGRQLGYLCFYKRNVDELQTQLKHLGRAEERLQRRVDDATRNGEEIEADVEELLTTVRKMIEDTDKFMRDEEQANTRCCTGAFPIPNLVLRHQLSRSANKMAHDVGTQIKGAENFDNKKISYRPLLPSSAECPHLSSSVENKDYQEFNTRKQTLSEVMRALRDPNVHVVGVWGMGGVGKTMLAKEVARKAKDEEKLFTEVVFTTISQTPTIEKILEDIRKCDAGALSEDTDTDNFSDSSLQALDYLEKTDRIQLPALKPAGVRRGVASCAPGRSKVEIGFANPRASVAAPVLVRRSS